MTTAVCVCSQPMRDNITMYRHLSLAGRIHKTIPGLVSNDNCCLCMQPANERQHYNVTSSLIGWAHSQNDPWTSQQWQLLFVYAAPWLSPVSHVWSIGINNTMPGATADWPGEWGRGIGWVHGYREKAKIDLSGAEVHCSGITRTKPWLLRSPKTMV